MSDRSLSIGVGIAEGISKALTNIENISQAREKTKREREEFTLNKKIKDAQLKKLEFETSPEAIERERTEFKQANQLFELELKTDQHKINIAELNERKKLMELKKEKDLRDAARATTLQDINMTEDEARNRSAALYPIRSANVGGRNVGVAPPEFVEDYSAYGRGEAREPFLEALSKAAQEKTSKTAEEAKKEFYGIKEEKLTQAKRSVIGDIRNLKNKNASIEDINEHINLQGYEPEDFTEELEGYEPVSFEEGDTEINKANLFGIGQKYDRRTKTVKGKKITYEKREDNLWHPIS